MKYIYKSLLLLTIISSLFVSCTFFKTKKDIIGKWNLRIYSTQNDYNQNGEILKNVNNYNEFYLADYLVLNEDLTLQSYSTKNTPSYQTGNYLLSEKNKTLELVFKESKTTKKYDVLELDEKHLIIRELKSLGLKNFPTDTKENTIIYLDRDSKTLESEYNYTLPQHNTWRTRKTQTDEEIKQKTVDILAYYKFTQLHAKNVFYTYYNEYSNPTPIRFYKTGPAFKKEKNCSLLYEAFQHDTIQFTKSYDLMERGFRRTKFRQIKSKGIDFNIEALDSIMYHIKQL